MSMPFEDPNSLSDWGSLRVSENADLAVLQVEGVRHAIVPPRGVTAETWVQERAEAERRKRRFGRAALVSITVLVLAFVTFAAAPSGSALSVSALILCPIALSCAFTFSSFAARVSMPAFHAAMPGALADLLTLRDLERLRRQPDSLSADRVVDILISRRLAGNSRGDTSTAIPVVPAA